LRKAQERRRRSAAVNFIQSLALKGDNTSEEVEMRARAVNELMLTFSKSKMTKQARSLL
jgi:hypothetical protein